MPQLGRFKQVVTPVSLIDNVLTVSVLDARTYNALTIGLSFFMSCAIYNVLGHSDALKVEMASEAACVLQ